MTGKYRLRNTITQLDVSKSDQEIEVPAELGIPWKGIKQQVEVPGRSGYVFARIRGDLSEVVHAFNDKVSLVYGLPVLLIRDRVDKSKWRVKSRDIGRYGAWSSYDLPFHGATHSFGPNPGADPVWVYGRQFMPFAAVPSGSSGGPGVVIQDGVGYVNNQFTYNSITGSPNILPAYLPTGSNTARIVLVYAEPGGNPGLLGGVEISESITGTSQIIQYVPALPTATALPIAAIRVTSGTTRILWDNMYDLRTLSSLPSSASAGHIIQRSGSSITPNRSYLNFVGNGITAYDDPINGKTIISGIFTPLYIDDLVDVNAPTPNTGDVLKWVGGEWINGTAGSSPVSWQRTVVVDQGGNGQFLTVWEACDYVATVSPKNATNPWCIYVAPGIYYEPEQIVVPSFAHIVGAFSPGYLYESPVRIHLQCTTGTAMTLDDNSGLVNLDVVYEESPTGDLVVIGFAPTGFINSASIAECSFDFDTTAGGYSLQGFNLDRAAVDLYMRNVLLQFNIDIYDPAYTAIQLQSSASRLFLQNSYIYAISPTDQFVLTVGSTGTTANVYAYNSYLQGKMWAYASSVMHFHNTGFTDTDMDNYISFEGENNATYLQGYFIYPAIPSNNDVLQFDAFTQRWNPAGLTIPSTLNDLTDVTLSASTSGQYLRYNGSQWINTTGTSGGGGATALDDLTDVTLTSVISGQYLQYNGAQWINVTGSFNAGFLRGYALQDKRPTDTQILRYNAANNQWQVEDYISSLDQLTDVVLTFPVSGQYLRYDGIDWINSAPSITSFEQESRVHAISVKTGASSPTITTRNIGASGGVSKPIIQFSKIIQQDVYFSIHAPDDMDFTKPAHFHLMWEPGAGWTAGNYVWKLEYLILDSGGTYLTSGTPTTISANVTPTSAIQNIETEYPDDIYLAYDQEMVCHFYRDVATDNGDDVGSVQFFELNYQSNLSGFGGGSGSPLALTDLTDVTISTAISGSSFMFDGSTWKNVTGTFITHNGLMGLTNPDHPATAIYTNTTNFTQLISGSAVNTQIALDQLDKHHHPAVVYWTYEGTISQIDDPKRIFNVFGYARRITKVFLSVGNSGAPAGADIIVDVKINNSSIFSPSSNRPKILAGQTSGFSTTIATPEWPDGAYLTISYVQVGSPTPGSDLVVHILHE